MKSTGIIMFVTILLVTACSPAVRYPTPLINVAQITTTSPQEYRIQAGDQLDIKFFYNPELNEPVVVRPDGRITLQLARDIIASGLTPAQLTETLKQKYAGEIAHPEITVIVRTFTAQKVYVDGEVTKAGLVSLTEPMTVLQSVSQAGGFKETARTDEVIIARRSANNKLITMVVNLEKAIDGSDRAQDISLMPNDLIYVPKSHVANVNLWIDQYVRKNIPIPIGAGFPLFR